jgi:hypothetical protein
MTNIMEHHLQQTHPALKDRTAASSSMHSSSSPQLRAGHADVSTAVCSIVSTGFGACHESRGGGRGLGALTAQCVLPCSG